MSSARFRFATDILRRLGEELNPSLDQGVVELVKNSHDADATSCVVSLTDVSAPGGVLSVVDDGDGMTAKDLEEHFLLLGRSPKERDVRTSRGRLLAGSKGLGRLAALRAGRIVEVRTASKHDLAEHHELRIDWGDFDHAETVDSVELQIQSSPRPEGTENGTAITVSSLTRAIGRREVKRLARALLLLADPFDDTPSGFQPRLDSPEFEDLQELVRRKYFDDAEYHLRVTVDDSGRATAVVTDWRGQELFSASHTDLSKTDQPYECPPAEFDLWVFILDAKTFQTRNSTVGEVREWLAEFGGVMLYLNGIRVPPYGDAGNDWLDMNLRRTRSPEERPGTNTSLGRVRVLDESGVIEAKTDRSGLIESTAFLSVRQFAQDSLDWMARERLRVAEARRRDDRTGSTAKSDRSSRDVRSAIEAAGAAAPDLEKAFGRYERARDRETQALRDEVQLYRTLSTAGITAATFAHESSGGPLKVIGRAVTTLRRRIKKLLQDVPEEIAEPLAAISSNAGSLAAFGDTTLDLVDRDKRRSGRVEIHEVITDVARTYSPFIEGRETQLNLELCDGTPYLRGSVAAVESIVVNLLTNALAALSESGGRERTIRVMTTVEDDYLHIRVDDTGPGIEEFSPAEIWLPGVTSRAGGSGLGLTIVRDTVADLGGEVSVKAHGDTGGAEFTIRLPIIGSE